MRLYTHTKYDECRLHTHTQYDGCQLYIHMCSVRKMWIMHVCTHTLSMMNTDYVHTYTKNNGYI